MHTLTAIIQFLIVFPVWVGTKIFWPFISEESDIKKYDPTIREWMKYGTIQALFAGSCFWFFVGYVFWIIFN